MSLDRQHYKDFFGLTDDEVDAMFEAFRETTSGESEPVLLVEQDGELKRLKVRSDGVVLGLDEVRGIVVEQLESM